MVIVYGTMMRGQADVVKNRFSVATEFFHVLWCPLLPVGSRVVFDQKAPRNIRRSIERPEDSRDSSEGEDPPAEKQAEEQAEEQTDEELRIPIPMCWKSVLLGYLRGWGFWLTALCGFLGGMLLLMSGSDAEAAQMFPGFLWTAGIAFAVAMATYYGPWNTAGPARAKQLCEAIGLDPSTLPDDLKQRMPDQPAL